MPGTLSNERSDITRLFIVNYLPKLSCIKWRYVLYTRFALVFVTGAARLVTVATPRKCTPPPIVELLGKNAFSRGSCRAINQVSRRWSAMFLPLPLSLFLAIFRREIVGAMRRRTHQFPADSRNGWVQVFNEARLTALALMYILKFKPRYLGDLNARDKSFNSRAPTVYFQL